MPAATLRRWVLVALIATIGLIHLVEAPDQFDEAAYLGILFLVTTAGSLVTIASLVRGDRWAVPLGLLIAVSTAGGYIISRTVGLPTLGVDPDVFEPAGVAAVIAEVAFIAVSLTALAGERQTATAVRA